MSSIINNWNEEQQSAYLYTIVASHALNPKIREMFENLAQMALSQSETWEALAQKQNITLPIFVPSLRARIVGWLVGKMGLYPMKSILAAMKIRGISALRLKVQLSAGHEIPTTIEDIGGRHKGHGVASNLRAGVFGVSDGLVSTASLVLGMMGAGAPPHTIMIAGIAGCLSGALSMATGEYISVKTQREMFEYQISLEEEELKQYPHEEALELALIYKARGFTPEEAKMISERMIADPEKGLDTLAREELGLNPEDLSSPWGAGITSFLSFVLGGILPLIPLLANKTIAAPKPTIIITLLSLLIVGGLISLWTGKGAVYSALRMALIGGVAGLITYFAGNIFSF